MAETNKGSTDNLKYMKAQSEIISSLLIIIIATGLVSTAYLWGVPLIQKQQDTALAERMYDSFSPSNSNSLPRRMQYVVNFGGDELYTAGAEGTWRLNSTENSLQFSFQSRVSNFANFSQAGWVSLSGSDCGDVRPGILGADASYVVCAKSEGQPGGRHTITYKVLFRDLGDTATDKTYRISLAPASGSQEASSFKSIRMSRGPATQSGGITATELKVLLQ